MSGGQVIDVHREARSVDDIPWRIPQFTELPMTVDYSLESPDYQIKNATWFVRMYPNGQSENETEGWVCMELKRLSDRPPDEHFSCRFGVKADDNVNVMTSEYFMGVNDMTLGPIKVIDRAEACDIDNHFLHGTSLTFFTRVRSQFYERTNESDESSTGSEDLYS